MNQYQPYTQENLDFLKQKYPLLTQPKLAKAFNAKFGQNRSVKAIAALCKRKGFKSGRTGCFQKGEKPWNTGTKGVCKPNSGSFVPGDRPDIRSPVGHERTDKRHGYIWKKVAQPNKFRLKHQLTWEEKHGAVPKGMVLWFVDGNRQNCDVANLELISKKEQLRRNQLQVSAAPKPVQDTLKLIAKIKVAVAEKTEAL